MLQSMTAFSRTESKDDIGAFTWEIRSVNHRYLEPSFRLPETLRELEPALRDILRKNLSRGKVECNLKMQLTSGQEAGININETLSSQVIDAAKLVKSKLGDDGADIDPLQVLQWPGILQEAETDAKAIRTTALDLFKTSINQLKDARDREGQELENYIGQRADSIEKIVSEVRTLLPTILKNQRQKLVDRLEEIKADLDPERVEQEMVILAQKSDVDEELDRLATHVTEVRRILKQKGPVGRKLDFLMQELNREANTLSSKSIVSDTTQAAVELKVLIEQMREQIQNIE